MKDGINIKAKNVTPPPQKNYKMISYTENNSPESTERTDYIKKPTYAPKNNSLENYLNEDI